MSVSESKAVLQNKQRLTTAQQSVGLPEETAQTAFIIYKQLYSDDLTHGRSIEELLSSCLYLASQMNSTPLSPKQIADEFNISKDKLFRASRRISAYLNLEIPPQDALSYIPKFCESLSASDTIQSKATDILQSYIENNQSSGKSPSGLAASAVYAASKLTDKSITQSEIATTAGISEVTIRSIYQDQIDSFNNENDTTEQSFDEAGQ